MKVQALPPVPSTPPARRSSHILFSFSSVCVLAGRLLKITTGGAYGETTDRQSPICQRGLAPQVPCQTAGHGWAVRYLSWQAWADPLRGTFRCRASTVLCDRRDQACIEVAAVRICFAPRCGRGLGQPAACALLLQRAKGQQNRRFRGRFGAKNHKSAQNQRWKLVVGEGPPAPAVATSPCPAPIYTQGVFE